MNRDTWYNWEGNVFTT